MTRSWEGMTRGHRRLAEESLCWRMEFPRVPSATGFGMSVLNAAQGDRPQGQLCETTDHMMNPWQVVTGMTPLCSAAWGRLHANSEHRITACLLKTFLSILPALGPVLTPTTSFTTVFVLLFFFFLLLKVLIHSVLEVLCFLSSHLCHKQNDLLSSLCAVELLLISLYCSFFFF